MYVYTILDENAEIAADDSKDMCAIAQRVAMNSIQSIWQDSSSPIELATPQIVCSRRAISRSTLPDIFTRDADDPTAILISSNDVLDYFNSHS